MIATETETQKITDQSPVPNEEPEVAAFLAYEHAISMLQKQAEQKLTNELHKLAHPNSKIK